MITNFDRGATRGGSEEKWQNSPEGTSREYLRLSSTYQQKRRNHIELLGASSAG